MAFCSAPANRPAVGLASPSCSSVAGEIRPLATEDGQARRGRNDPDGSLRDGGGSGGTGAALAAAPPAPRSASWNAIRSSAEPPPTAWSAFRARSSGPMASHATCSAKCKRIRWASRQVSRTNDLLGPRTIQGKQVKQTSVWLNRAMDYAVRSLLEATGRCQTLLATTFCLAQKGERHAQVGGSLVCGQADADRGRRVYRLHPRR